MAPTSIERLVAGLDEAFASRGLSVTSRPPEGDLAVLDEIARTVAPFRIPDALRAFWTTVDVRTLPETPYPRPTTLAFALDTWTTQQESFPGTAPPSLFPYCYESHGYMFIELDQPERRGGDVFYYFSEGDPVSRYLPSLEDWLEVYIEALKVHDFEDDSKLFSQTVDRLAGERLSASEEHPVYGRVATYECDPIVWPDHWLAAAGIPADRFEIRGATHTIEEVELARQAGQEVRARIQGVVGGASGSTGGTSAKIVDDTGSMWVLVPDAPGNSGPVMRRPFELDIVAGPVDVANETHQAFKAAADPVARALAERLPDQNSAIATAIRPLDRQRPG